MEMFLSAMTAVLSLSLTAQLGWQFWKRRKPYQVVWSFAMLLFAIGAGCQWLATISGWNGVSYRLWYLTGAILTAAYLGQGTIYLQAKRKVAHITMTLLVFASIFAAFMVFQAPVDLNTAQASAIISGQGMPRNIRLLTPFFNIFGTVALVGGALRSTAYFLWNGYGNQRAMGTGLIAIGAIVVAMGGTLSRFQIPQLLYTSELVGIFIIFVGFLLMNRAVPKIEWTSAELKQRRRRIARYGVGVGVVTIFGALSLLPILPWTMNIVTDAVHVYIEEVPEENKGVYLTTDDGVMQLYTWRIPPERFPEDAPTLDADNIQEIVVNYKHFSPADQYQLYEVNTRKHIDWTDAWQEGSHLTLIPSKPLQSGDYMLIVPTDSMFGGNTTHYFHLL